mmetsp:Transcript_39191/g.64203  ORF Transcript_39191/g.64203 Transcript_39191/m.64203 type:complete len:177 (+) Transcript_39191:3-533(+)
MGVNCINFKMNIDKSDGKLCCHVCSLEENANSKGESIATASLHLHQGHAATPVPSTPRSHSLLTYFQPTKKQAAPYPPPKSQAPITNSHQRETSPMQDTVPSNLSRCRYCDNPTCITCTRQCEQCQHRFCTFCTKVDYESSVVERIMCFECDGCVGNSGSGMGGRKDDGDCDMMDM